MFSDRIGAVILAVITIINLNLCVANGAEKLGVKKESQFGFEFTSGVANQYRAFTSGLGLYKGAVVQSDLLTTYKPWGLYMDIWNSIGLDGKFDKSKLDDEVDLNIGLARPLGKGYGFDIGVSYYNEPDMGTLGKGDIWWTYAEINKTVTNVLGFEYTFQPFVRFDAFTPNKGSGFKGDKVISFGSRTSFNLIGDWLSVPVKTSFGYVTEGFGVDAGFRFKVQTGINVKVSKHLSLFLPNVAVYAPLGWNAYRTEAVTSGGLVLTY